MREITSSNMFKSYLEAFQYMEPVQSLVEVRRSISSSTTSFLKSTKLIGSNLSG